MLDKKRYGWLRNLIGPSRSPKRESIPPTLRATTDGSRRACNPAEDEGVGWNLQVEIGDRVEKDRSQGSRTTCGQNPAFPVIADDRGSRSAR